jgi:hypothetical protein
MQPNSSQSSFIPKRGATRAKRRKPTKRIFLFSLVSYSLIFASLLASGASYLYKNYSISILQNEVVLLNSEINTFSVRDLSVVSEFDLTLRRATDRFNNSASVAAVLDELDLATAQPVQIVSLTMERSGDQNMLVVAKVVAQSFDGALFQRELFNLNESLFSDVVFEDVSKITNQDEGRGTVTTTNQELVTFTATVQVPIQSLSYDKFHQPAVQNTPAPIDNQTTI